MAVYAIVETTCSPIETRKSKTDLMSLKRLINREVPSLLTHQERKRITRAIVDPDIESLAQTSGTSELLQTAPQTYSYYPYFRIRRIFKKRNNDNNEPPLSNYADPYDHFPTVA